MQRQSNHSEICDLAVWNNSCCCSKQNRSLTQRADHPHKESITHTKSVSTRPTTMWPNRLYMVYNSIRKNYCSCFKYCKLYIKYLRSIYYSNLILNEDNQKYQWHKHYCYLGRRRNTSVGFLSSKDKKKEIRAQNHCYNRSNASSQTNKYPNNKIAQ